MTRKPTNYWDYIKVEELLTLQRGLAVDEGTLANDEVMFITIHQIDELWMKLVLRELVGVRDLFAGAVVPEQSLASAVRGLRRVSMLFSHMATHFELMETMTTRDYLAFRDKLSPASGFQSAQLREIEVLLGLNDGDRLPLGHEGSYLDALKDPGGARSPAYDRVIARIADRPTLREAIHTWLYRTPIQGSRPDEGGDEEAVGGFIEDFLGAHARQVETVRSRAIGDALTEKDRRRLATRFTAELDGARTFLTAASHPEEDRPRLRRIRAALVFIESYRELPLLAWPREVLDALVAMEQAAVIFRQRHARMVERVIGRRTGTGGSAGVDYLDQTALKYRVLDEVWAVRTLLLREDALPPVRRPEHYGLAVAT